MKIRNVLLAVTTLAAVVPVVSGCSAHAQITAATPPPPPPPEPPPPPPPPKPAPPRMKGNFHGTKIDLPGELEFHTGKATIKEGPKNEAVLQAVLTTLNDSPSLTKLRIEGHTDNVGTEPYNQKLSQDRADNVAKWLVAHGIDAGRIETKGFGSSRPLVPNDSEEHKHMNRRTEFHVAAIDGQPANDNTLVPPGGGDIPAPPH
jgi:outer membrane protein OmpA-like peptidoglycan-associated protein